MTLRVFPLVCFMFSTTPVSQTLRAEVLSLRLITEPMKQNISCLRVQSLLIEQRHFCVPVHYLNITATKYNQYVNSSGSESS